MPTATAAIAAAAAGAARAPYADRPARALLCRPVEQQRWDQRLVADSPSRLVVEGLGQAALEIVWVHRLPPSTSWRVAIPRLAADFTEPCEIPSVWAISRSDSPDQ